MPVDVLHFWCQVTSIDKQLCPASSFVPCRAVGLKRDVCHVKALLLCVVDGHSKCKVEGSVITTDSCRGQKTPRMTAQDEQHTHTQTHTKNRFTNPQEENIPCYCGKHVAHPTDGKETTKFVSLAGNTWTANQREQTSTNKTRTKLCVCVWRESKRGWT